MPDQVTNYKCPACGGPVHFDSATGRLRCDFCENSYTPEEIAALYAQQDAQAAQAFQDQPDTPENGQTQDNAPSPQEGEQPAADTHWDTSGIATDWGEAQGEMRSYNCPSCGATLLCEQTTAATQCPYCGNPAIVPGQFKGALKPDFVIPFALDHKAAQAALKRHYRGRLFLPRSFTDQNQIKKLQGIYVPFWLYDADAAVECQYHATRSRSWMQGNYRITDTDHFDVRRYGSVRFERVPTDASKKMPNDLMDSLEPFDYSGLVPFSTAYLPGFFADKYDVSIKQNAPRAEKRCKTTAEELMRADVHGYATVKLAHSSIHLDRRRVSYALLPVWIIQTKWKDKNYIFAMNGQTGKFVGDLPNSKTRFWGFCGILTALFTVLFFFTPISALFSGIAEIFREMFFG